MTYSIGIDLGGTKVLTALINKKTGEVVSSVKKKTRKDKGPSKIVEKIIESVSELIAENKISKSDISSIGIGVAGQVDRKNGILLSAPNLDCFNVNIKEIIEKEFSIPTYVGNDVEIATLGEIKFGAGVGYKNLVCVFVGTGVGSGIVRDGELYTGATGTAGEIGHIVVDYGGRQCGCGAMGCLEAYASRSAIEKRITGALKKGRNSIILDYMEDGKSMSSGMIKKALEQGDELVTQALDEASEYLSAGLASVINFINPELIILGGGLIDAIDYFYNKTILKAHVKALPTPASKIEFKKAQLGDYSGVIGAAFLSDARGNK